MSKYRQLTQHLSEFDGSHWRASFKEIENVLGFTLPKSAYEHPAWWANQAGGHAQSSAWQDAGWRTENLDLESQKVTFVRHWGNALAGSFNALENPKKPFLSGTNALAASPPGQRNFLEGVTSHAQPLTIAQAKAGLALTFGVSEDCIEILIKG